MAVSTACFTIGNRYEFNNDGTMTKDEYAAFIRPTLELWFSELGDNAKTRKVDQTINLIVDNCDNVFADSVIESESETKWNLIMERVSVGKCGVCGKVLPPSFVTMEAINKFNGDPVTLTFCVPCMQT
jgi:hypothetical protein